MTRRLFKKRFLKRIMKVGNVSHEIAMCEFDAIIEDIQDMGVFEDPEYYADECIAGLIRL